MTRRFLVLHHSIRLNCDYSFIIMLHFQSNVLTHTHTHTHTSSCILTSKWRVCCPRHVLGAVKITYVNKATQNEEMSRYLTDFIVLPSSDLVRRCPFPRSPSCLYLDMLGVSGTYLTLLNFNSKLNSVHFPNCQVNDHSAINCEISRFFRWRCVRSEITIYWFSAISKFIKSVKVDWSTQIFIPECCCC